MREGFKENEWNLFIHWHLMTLQVSWSRWGHWCFSHQRISWRQREKFPGPRLNSEDTRISLVFLFNYRPIYNAALEKAKTRTSLNFLYRCIQSWSSSCPWDWEEKKHLLNTRFFCDKFFLQFGWNGGNSNLDRNLSIILINHIISRSIWMIIN